MSLKHLKLFRNAWANVKHIQCWMWTELKVLEFVSGALTWQMKKALKVHEASKRFNENICLTIK